LKGCEKSCKFTRHDTTKLKQVKRKKRGDEVKGKEVVEITGYIVSERLSKPIGKEYKYLEKVEFGAFHRALEKGNNILALLNHDREKVLAQTSDSTLKLKEDNIGLRITLKTDNPHVVRKAKHNKLVGFSFGFVPKIAHYKKLKGDTRASKQRILQDFILEEISVLDDNAKPKYEGTVIETRFLETRSTIKVYCRRTEVIAYEHRLNRLKANSR